MNTLKCIVIFLILADPLVLMAEEAPAGMHEFNVKCPAENLIPILDTAYHECNNGFVKKGSSCEKFVEVFKQVLPVYDCQRPIETRSTPKYIVPAIWLAGDGAADDYIRLLWRLASQKEKMFKDNLFHRPVIEAKAIFSSKEFRDILSGETAEDYDDLSKSMEQELAKSRK
jgi:hypothetical protein